MRIVTTSFVEASDLFENCLEAWDVFCNSDPNCSWGDNNRTLINASYIGSVLEDYDVDEDSSPDLSEQISTVLKRIKETGGQLQDGSNDDFYVDLEN